MNIKSKKRKDVVSFILIISIILSCFGLFSVGAAADGQNNTDTSQEVSTDILADAAGNPESYANANANYSNYAQISVSIDYAGETITLGGKTGGGPVKYMYSPNATVSTAGKKLAAEKWYPIYGDTVSITPYIPSSGSEILFAFRDADELPNIDGTYSSRVVSAPIPGRPNISPNDFKNSVKYDPQSETIRISADILPVYDYQIGRIGEGIWLTNNTDYSIDVSSKYNAMGGTAVIRKSATNSSFASNEYKIKIPAAPSIPKVKVNESTKKIIGIMTGTNGYAWSVSANGVYSPFANRIIDLNDFENQMGKSLGEFSEESNMPSLGSANIVNSMDSYIIIYIKILATDKRPSSPVQKLYVKKSLIEDSMKK